MRCKKSSLVINPRSGQNVEKLTDILAVLSAADWKTTIALKEYGGQIVKLASEASQKCELVIAYGGDGTINQVINGIMQSGKKTQSSVGIIPGGTANMWAGDIGVPSDPVKAALALINSEERKVDVGHVDVQVDFPDTTGPEQQQQPQRKKARKKKNAKAANSKKSGKARQHFLLMAGLGFDAEVMRHVSKPFKHQVGPLAVGLAAAKNATESNEFPIEIYATEGTQEEEKLLWRGDAIQAIIGNTRRYAMLLETTPNAYIDDGMLDVCVITAGDPLSTMQQVGALLLRHKPDTKTTQTFQGERLTIKVPATVPLEVDGSAVKLKDFLDKSTYNKIEESTDPGQIMVAYRFEALPRAVSVAIPRNYNDDLFKYTRDGESRIVHTDPNNNGEEQQHDTAVQDNEHARSEQGSTEQTINSSREERTHEIKQELPELIQTLLTQGRKVTVLDKAPDPERHDTYIIAGSTPKPIVGDMKPVAIVVNEQTTIFNREGVQVSSEMIKDLQEGAIVVVEGKRNQRGVIRATQLVL